MKGQRWYSANSTARVDLWTGAEGFGYAKVCNASLFFVSSQVTCTSSDFLSPIVYRLAAISTYHILKSQVTERIPDSLEICCLLKYPRGLVT